MDFVKKCKRVLGSSKRLHPEESGSGSYGRLRNKQRQQKKKKLRVAPHGCLCVYVGAERERFIIKIKMANHPLFKALLDGAEREYSYRNDGPLWLPCNVDLFCEALAEMEIGTQEDDMDSAGCIGHSYRHNPSSVYSLSCKYLTESFIDSYETLVK